MPHDNGSSASSRSQRNVKPMEKFGNYATPEEVKASDSEFMEPEEADEAGDQDWIQNVEGRPAPFTDTWATVYGKRTPTATGFEITCAEACGDIIRMNSHLHEIDAVSTPHGKPRRPPVCHIVPWAALAIVLKDYARLAGKVHTPDFIRSVCWEHSNLRPGHNGCNAAGVKVMASNISPAEMRDAKAVVDKVTIAYPSSLFL